jgi:hypothetical protein
METVIMGVIRKGARAQAKAAEAEAGLAEAEAKVAQEQAAAIARALHEDEVHRRADLEEVAGEEAEAVPWSRHAAADAGTQAVPDRQEHSRLCPLIGVVDAGGYPEKPEFAACRFMAIPPVPRSLMPAQGTRTRICLQFRVL